MAHAPRRPINKHSDRPRASKGFAPHQHSHRPANAPQQRITPAASLVLSFLGSSVRGFGKEHKSALCAAFSNATNMEIANLQLHHPMDKTYREVLSKIVTTSVSKDPSELIDHLQKLLGKFPNSPYVAARQINLAFALGHMEKAEGHARRFHDLCRSQGLSMAQGNEIRMALTRG